MKLGARKRAWLYMMLKIGSMTKSGMENKKKSIKTKFKFKFPPKKLKIAQIELKIDFPGFQTMGMNVAQ